MYICCAQAEFHLTWAENYAKIRGVFIDKKELIDKLIEDISAYLASLTTVGMVPFLNNDNYHSNKLLTSEHLRFMWMRFFCALMARLSSDKSLPLKTSLVATNTINFNKNASMILNEPTIFRIRYLNFVLLSLIFRIKSLNCIRFNTPMIQNNSLLIEVKV
jgi:hypothetical protein